MPLVSKQEILTVDSQADVGSDPGGSVIIQNHW